MKKEALRVAITLLLVLTLGLFPSAAFAFVAGEDSSIQSEAVKSVQAAEGELEESLATEEPSDESGLLNEGEPSGENGLLDESETSEENENLDGAVGVSETESNSTGSNDAVALRSGGKALRADISSQLRNLTWSMRRASDGVEPNRDQGSDPTDYTNEFTHYQPVYIVMNFDVGAPSGVGFQSGDTISFPFLQGNAISVSNTAEEKLIAGDGQTVLGTWKISERNIVIVFNDKVVGQTSLNNCTISTAKTLRPYNQSVVDKVETYTVGETSHSYRIGGLTRAPVTSYMGKSLSATTNQSVRWLIGVGGSLVDDLTRSRGASMEDVSSLIFEDEIPASEASKGISTINITARVPFIMSESDQTAASASGTTLLEKEATTYFERISQISSDIDYDTFKKRVGPFQYGIYDAEDGSYKFIINFGDPQSSDYAVTYSQLFPNLKQSIIDANKGVSEEEAEIIADSLGDENCIGGSVIYWLFYLTTEYSPTFVSTEKANTGTLTFDLNGASTVESSSAQGTLQAGSAVAFPMASQATIAKADSVSGAPLENVVFKLQHSVDGGTLWLDANYPAVTTNSEGQATTGTLAPGMYRFVEESGLDGYDTQNATYTSSTGENGGVFTISSNDASGVVVTATNTPRFYTVHYNTDGGGEIAAKTGVRYQDTGLLPIRDPIKTGTTFIGWEVENSGAAGTHNRKRVTDTQAYSEISDTADTAEVTLKALYVDRSYIVNYDTNGGMPGAIPQKTNIKWSDDDLLPSSDPTRDGYTFTGWLVSEGGAIGTPASSTSQYSSLVTSDATTAITLQAQWTEKTPAALTDVVVNTILIGTPPDAEAFTYEMTLVSGDSSGVTLPPSTTTPPILTGDTTAVFETLDFTKAGTYTFDIIQTPGSTPGLTYDNSTITMTVVVTEEEASFTVSPPTIMRDGVPSDILFTNIYAAQSVTTENLMIEKIVSGETPATPSTFVFNLIAGHERYPMPVNAVGATAELSLAGQGVGSFDSWTYEETGIYVYTVVEQDTQIEDYTYDARVYTVTDVVIDTAGVLSFSRSIHDGETEVSSIIFTNRYDQPLDPNGSGGSDTNNGGSSGENNNEKGNSSIQSTTDEKTGMQATAGGGANSGGRGLPITGDFGVALGIVVIATISAVVIVLHGKRKGGGK